MQPNSQELRISRLPIVSVIVPVYNEELVIERRINNIFESSYPKDKIELIVVDSGSNDRTRTIITQKFRDKVILITEHQRKGKAHAINLALKRCSGDIILLTDAPTLYEKDTIFHLIAPFEDPSIGGVSVLYRISNIRKTKITSSESLFWFYKDQIRILESKAYSTSWLSGEACAFRTKIISHVHEDTLADDSNIALQIISQGYKVIVNENSYFMEKSPSKVDEFFKIKVRRALGGLREVLRFRFFLFNCRYGLFGLIIFPYRFFTQLVSPIALVAALVLAIPAMIDISKYFVNYISIIVALVLIICVFCLRNKIIAYLYMHLIMFTALLLLLKRKPTVQWVQSKTTRS